MTDEINPTAKWQFDEDVTAVFDDMLARSIPQYEVMRQAVYDLACKYIRPHTTVISLGSSRGEDVARLIENNATHNEFVLTDVSEPMADCLRGRFPQEFVSVLEYDLRYNYPLTQYSVTLCILTLQFIPIEYRQKIMQQIYDHLLPGGALIIVEKVLGANAGVNETLVDLYYQMKSANGYTQEQIDRKRMALEGVLVPVTADWNVELMRMAGFKSIDCFWRWMNFAGWLAVKGE